MSAYYNEVDPYAAEWLTNLIKAGHIAAGDVDNRSIEDVKPSDLRGYTQCHFFAGIGVWSYALRLAQWHDDRAVWTGSCPCQPFSVAGRNAGMRDERHLWPTWHWLIEQCRPSVVFGEQVEAAIKHGWLDLVQADLEGVGYTFGEVDFPAAGVGAPHIRQRLYWVADALHTGWTEWRPESGHRQVAGGGELERMANTSSEGSQGRGSAWATRPEVEGSAAERDSEVSRLADPDGTGQQSGKRHGAAAGHRDSVTATGSNDRHDTTRPTNGHWRDADWLFCRDGRWRPVEPGTFPLAHGAPARVGRLRAYGNAIVAPQAAEVIRAYMECRP